MTKASSLQRQALVVSYHVVGPDRDSGSRRHFHLLSFLQEAGWTVHFFAADGPERWADVRRLQRLGITVHDGTRERIEDVLREACPDLVVTAFWSNASRFLPAIRASRPDARVIVDSVDLHFVREARSALAVSGELWFGLGRFQAEAYARELVTYAGCDGILTVSQKEADLVGDLLGAKDSVYCVPDSEDMEPSRVRFAERHGMVLLGSFQHPPNTEATVHFLREILPRLDHRLLDDHPLYVIGNALPDYIRRLGSGHRRVEMVGWVPDVEPYLAASRISVIPLLHGAGTKRKLLQSLAIGTPAVSTSIGIEGLSLTHEEHILVADEPASFATGIERLLTDEGLWEHLRESGLQTIGQSHGRSESQSAFMDAIDAVMAKAPNRIVPVGISHQHAIEVPGDRLAENSRILSVARRILPRGCQLAVVGNDVRELTNLLRDHGWSATSIPDEERTSDAGLSLSHAARLSESTGLDGAQYAVVTLRSMDYLEVDHERRQDLTYSFRAIHRDEVVVLLKAAGNHIPVAIDGRREHGHVRLIAFYLPQFHPIPENDVWWGPGFTEWRNVARARPLFEGHYQPHVPGDLGFYDLRLPEVRQAQAELAGAHGIHGFCYYHYWFEGRVLLGRPFEEVLQSGEPNFPFCLAWVNESWSRRWDGRENDLLIHQGYSPEDDRTHIRALIPALTDPRAITVDGRPMFLVWRASSMPDAQRTTDIWRDEADHAGLSGIHLVAIETAWEPGWDATRLGFDAKVLFQPQFGWLMTEATKRGARLDTTGSVGLEVYDYDAVLQGLRDFAPVPYRRYECVFPSWDNTARKGRNAVIVHGSTPKAYEAWLRDAVSRASVQPSTDRFVFINAWNEWAEGCHLEPDRRHGMAYLEATNRALTGARISPAVAARLET